MPPTQTDQLFEDAQLQTAVGLSVAPSPAAIEPLVHNLLLALGEDPNREGLRRTPERVARMAQELLEGYQTDLTRLVNGAVFDTDFQDMVLVRNLSFYSLCEHHLLPFFGHAHVAYVPDGKLIGLSKIPRLVDMFARRLQVQERLTQQVAETLQDILHPRGIAVVVEGAHLCAMMRGVKKSEARMVTSVLLGDFRTDERLRQDLFNQLQLHASPAPDLEF
ncbi:MAG TPA: GTP cyclohydrolase I FolE [Anaerolineaceae bacterium]|nr:GTP cyclohydrolase I FolE [Anaerolineaceae bacterium]